MSIGKIRPQILNMPAEKKVEPFSVDFAYTGTVQEYVVPVTGLYKLEVYGAGASSTRATGKGGGISIGYKKLKKGTKLYVCCGGYSTGGGNTYSGNGYNGGGGCACNWTNSPSYASSGGGATHIALITGTLANIGRSQFNTQGLLIAGGGGGGSCWDDEWGNNGGKGNSSASSSNTFGAGKSRGSGYYDGNWVNWTWGGGQGSIIGVPELTYKGVTYSPSMTVGGNSGNGKATITLIAKAFPTIHAFGKDIIGGYAYGKEISDIKAFGKDLA